MLKSTSSLTLGLRGDEDDDDAPVKDPKPTPNDDDADFDNDTAAASPKGYYDADDAWLRSYGRAANAGERRTVTATVDSYHTAAVARNGSAACSLLKPNVAQAIVELYGRPPGPGYLRGSTCGAVMSRLFWHERRRLKGGIVVIDVRVQGTQASASVGSRTMPANYLVLERDRAGWKIGQILGMGFP